ncbi:hypothetical protein FA13DRAFT_100658 [Coprinellus micaceus]|uniref:Uncharacterized protein n=1 Tax=Coprinellus micaceus TaxID=71717 RepID=A0A4Y7SIA4_COPMI|nr:hypothetical protein FA13DRAFT_100658 [Coprinellus micaceus]
MNTDHRYSRRGISRYDCRKHPRSRFNGISVERPLTDHSRALEARHGCPWWLPPSSQRRRLQFNSVQNEKSLPLVWHTYLGYRPSANTSPRECAADNLDLSNTLSSFCGGGERGRQTLRITYGPISRRISLASESTGLYLAMNDMEASKSGHVPLSRRSARSTLGYAFTS